MSFKQKDCAVYVDGKCICVLNDQLLDRQGIGAVQLRELKKLHRQKYRTFQQIQNQIYLGIPSRAKLDALVAKVTNIEFGLQDVWGFPRDENYHQWFRLPGCSCPKLDNADFVGTALRIYSHDCPLHKMRLHKMKLQQSDQPVKVLPPIQWADTVNLCSSL